MPSLTDYGQLEHHQLDVINVMYSNSSDHKCYGVTLLHSELMLLDIPQIEIRHVASVSSIFLHKGRRTSPLHLQVFSNQTPLTEKTVSTCYDVERGQTQFACIPLTPPHPTVTHRSKQLSTKLLYILEHLNVIKKFSSDF